MPAPRTSVLGLAVRGAAAPVVVAAGWQSLPWDDAPAPRCRVRSGQLRGCAVLLVRLAAPACTLILLNGRPVGRLAVQSPGDEITVSGLPAWRLVERVESQRLVVHDHLAGRTCPLCRTPLQAGRFALACRCGALLHDDEPATAPAGSDADEPLACARLSPTCPSCLGELSTAPVWRPVLEEL